MQGKCIWLKFFSASLFKVKIMINTVLKKSAVAGIYTRKNQKQYRTRRGAWYPVGSTVLVDSIEDFSEFLHFGRAVGFEWITLTSADIIIAYDGGRTYRTSVPAGTLIRRVSNGCPAGAGQVAVILPV